ncbi:acyltransferase family protein [Sphingomonas sp.]|uniref:acyltransferase family protein n=1 Tax=Sphingomonas sp. TaxID=28214 RepID=UPI0035BC0DB8
MDVFIILSGFVIFRLIDLKRESYLPYITRRALRIFPLYLVVLIVSSALLPITVHAFDGLKGIGDMNEGGIVNARESIRNFPYHFVAHAILLQGLIPENVLPKTAAAIVGQAWSVSMEWQFYLIAPFVYLGVTNRRIAPLLVLFIAALLLVSSGMSVAFLGRRPQLFGIGIASYYLVRDRRANASFRAVVIAVLSALCVFSVIHNGVSQILPLSIWLAALLTMRPTSSRFRSYISRALGSETLVWFGERSYSIYLVHTIPLTLWTFMFNRMNGAAWLYAPTMIVVTIVGTLTLSFYSYRLIEQPGIRYGAPLVRRFRAHG